MTDLFNALIEMLILNPGSGPRKHVARALSALTLALIAILIIFAVGDMSWKNASIVLGITAFFWLLLTIVDLSFSALTRSGKAQ